MSPQPQPNKVEQMTCPTIPKKQQHKIQPIYPFFFWGGGGGGRGAVTRNKEFCQGALKTSKWDKVNSYLFVYC